MKLFGQPGGDVGYYLRVAVKRSEFSRSAGEIQFFKVYLAQVQIVIAAEENHAVG